ALLFFFQAEDGIRDKLVTGVQTCALPIYRAHDPAAHRTLLRAEYMLDASADSALGAVRSRLRIRQWMVAAGTPMNTAVEAPDLELRLDLGRAIGAVGEHIC